MVILVATKDKGDEDDDYYYSNFWVRVSFCNPCCPGALCTDQSDLDLRFTEILPLPLSGRIKGMHHHALANLKTFKEV